MRRDKLTGNIFRENSIAAYLRQAASIQEAEFSLQIIIDDGTSHAICCTPPVKYINRAGEE